MQIKLFRHIRPQYNINLILARLGYKRGFTEYAPEVEAWLMHLVKQCESLCDIATAYGTMGIATNENGVIILKDGTVLKGRALSQLLSRSDEVVLMASTAGSRITEAISSMMKEGRASEAVVLDAAASEIADAGLDFLMDYIRTQLMKLGRTLTQMRFSPGYGDFVLEQQRDFARLLEIEKLNISITDSCLLLPEKSVMAVAGIVSIEA